MKKQPLPWGVEESGLQIRTWWDIETEDEGYIISNQYNPQGCGNKQGWRSTQKLLQKLRAILIDEDK